MWKYFTNLWLFAAITMIFIGFMDDNAFFVSLGILSAFLSFGGLKKDDKDKTKNKSISKVK